MKHLLRTITIGIAIALAAGCASTPTTSGYLRDYSRLQPGQYLEKYWADKTHIKQSGSPAILLGEISVDNISDQKGITVAGCVAILKSSLEDGGIVSSDYQDTPVRLDLAITYMDPGSAAKRVWAGELGAGHAQVQIEGRVTDTTSGNVLATFAERRRSSGYIGIKDIGGDSGPSLIKQMITLISGDVTNELRQTFSQTQVQ
ncbi:DUF4410 domain-containing protein [Thiolapillus sp.]